MENKLNVLDEYDNKRNLYQEFTSEVERLLNRFLTDDGIKCNAIVSRLKNRESLSEKIDRKHDKYKNLGSITDIAGIRVITYYAEDVNKVADIIEREFIIDKENSIDKREALEPDRFGYCSVHYVAEMNQNRLSLREYQAFSGLKCEIQIRSVLQHAWAEIEHDLGYKSEIGIPRDIRRNFSRLAGLMEIADKEFQEIRSFLQSYQKDAIEKIQHDELADVELDTILLETIINSDKDILEINNKIASVIEEEFGGYLTIGNLEETIYELQWFNINTLSELRNFISRNKKCAIEIASEYLTNEKIYNFTDAIAFFYLCYAELLQNNYGYSEVMEYFSDNNIEINIDKRKQAVEKLLQLRKKLGIPIDKKEA